ncbi:MAG TPA: peptidylprolyl isomerase, partial [Polyangiaceae bacterium]|nr:peptidylprolyl isomerase [Polyangiaceae bacterium]
FKKLINLALKEQGHKPPASAAFSAASPTPPTTATPIPADMIEASHILVQYAGALRAPDSIKRSKEDARKRAQEVLNLAQRGADFTKLAIEYSDEPGAATRGGALGRFTHAQMVKPFADAAFALKAGELSGIVETDFGFHVIKRSH